MGMFREAGGGGVGEDEGGREMEAMGGCRRAAVRGAAGGRRRSVMVG